MLVPNSKTCRRSTHVGPLAVAGPQPRIDPHRNGLPRKLLPEQAELMYGTGIKNSALFHQFLQTFRWFLGRQLNVRRRYPCQNRTPGLVLAARINM